MRKMLRMSITWSMDHGWYFSSEIDEKNKILIVLTYFIIFRHFQTENLPSIFMSRF